MHHQDRLEQHSTCSILASLNFSAPTLASCSVHLVLVTVRQLAVMCHRACNMMHTTNASILLMGT